MAPENEPHVMPTHSPVLRKAAGIRLDTGRDWGTDDAKTDIVVPVIGIVPVAIRAGEILLIVVPGAAAQRTVSVWLISVKSKP